MAFWGSWLLSWGFLLVLQTAYHDAISETSVSRRTLQKLRRFLTKPRNKEAVRLTNQITLTILKIQEGAVRNGQLPSAKSNNKNDRLAWKAVGGHFLLLCISLKIAHEIWKVTKTAPPSRPSNAIVSVRVIRHPPFRVCVRGKQQ